jgi:CelD/BcsL family acetyltransferase involved in cellulose biosynthesis
VATDVQASVVENDTEFRALHGGWSELLHDSPADCVFLTWEWSYTWWRHLSRGGHLYIVTVRAGRRLIAIAPFFTHRDSVAAFGLWRTCALLGAGTVGSDYLDIIVRRGWEAEARRALAEQLTVQGLMVQAPRVVPGRSQFLALGTDLESRGWHQAIVKHSVCPCITLRNLTWRSYLGTLGPSHRGNLRRRLRALRQAFAVELESVDSEAQRREALDALIRLHNERWRGRGGSTAFHTEPLRRFHDELTRLLLDRRWLRLYVLRLDGAPAAVLYGFSYGRRFHFYQSGFDERFARHSVGLVLMGLSIERAIGEHELEYDLLHGDEPYKQLWCPETRDVVDVELYPPRMSGWLYRESVCLSRHARRLARRFVAPVTRIPRRSGGINGRHQAMASPAS